MNQTNEAKQGAAGKRFAEWFEANKYEFTSDYCKYGPIEAAYLAWSAALKAQPAPTEVPITFQDVQDAARLAWSVALDSAAFYVVGHCGDGDFHAEAILGMPMPEIKFRSEVAPTEAQGEVPNLGNLAAQGEPTAQQYDEMLRALCCQYGVGGYNSDGLINPDVAGEKLAAALDEQFRVGGEPSFNRARGELRDAAAAVVARWDSPKWKDEPHTAVFIDRLRKALQPSGNTGELAQGEDSARPSKLYQCITSPGQVKVGDKLRFNIGDDTHLVTAKQLLHAGTDKEEIIYNKRQNYYLITSMAIANRGSQKNCEFRARASTETGGVKS